jgi:predicted Zn-dependent peptidase
VKLKIFAVLLSASLFSPSLYADTVPLEKRVIEHTLANGIKLLVLERHFSPTVSCRMMFRVGSVDEVNGKTGLAHMFEHMMFKGTRTLGTRDYASEAVVLKKLDELHRQLDAEKRKGPDANQPMISQMIDQLRSVEETANSFVIPNELWQLYEREGGSSLNASTSHDWTRYTINLPSNKLALWAILDSDRIKNPVFREFYSEREVVKEERRMRVDTSPDGLLLERFLTTAYTAHPYRMPTIGWESDLDHLSMADLDAFYHRYYTPDQLTIAIVGDVKADDVIALVEKYFGDWKAQPADRNWITEEPAALGPKRATVTFNAEPQLVVGYPVAAWPDPDHVLADALSNLLSSGLSSRLHEALVERRKMVSGVEIDTNFPGTRYSPQFLIFMTPRYPYTNDQVLKALEAEIEKVKKEPVADWETEKVRSSVEMVLLSTLQTNDGLADTLVGAQSIYRDWHYLMRYQEQIAKITGADLQAAARRIFDPAKQTVTMLEKKAPVKAAPRETPKP